MKSLVIINAQKVIEYETDEQMIQHIDLIIKTMEQCGWEATVDYDERCDNGQAKRKE